MVKKVFQIFMLMSSLVLHMNGQIMYTVNSNNDVDDGVCNAVHCSLREAIKASEADGMASNIVFNIPGPSPIIIVPTGPYPTINGNNTNISFNATPASEILINFSYRDMLGVPVFQINGMNNSINGLSFTKMLYNNNNDHIIRIGDVAKNASNTSITNCRFFEDNSVALNIDRKSIDIVQSTNAIVKNNSFGTDISNSGLFSTEGSIKVEANQGIENFSISNNIFVTTKNAIVIQGGNGIVDQNLFGAYDTTKNKNFLDPPFAIEINAGAGCLIDTNFFFGQKKYSIVSLNSAGLLEIKRNRFYFTDTTMSFQGIGNATIGIVNNFAREGVKYVDCRSTGNYSLNIDKNDVSVYDNFYTNLLDPGINLSSYNNNAITCIKNSPVILDGTLSPKPYNPPTIVSVNRTQIVGTANPNMFVAVYANSSTQLCSNAPTSCQGGFLLGITQANAVGSWMLNVNYPNKHFITAYQYRLGTGYNIFSEFSPCYVCPAPFKENFNPDLCATSSVTYHGKNYSAATPYDSIVVKGDGVSICDSTFVININVKSATREVRNVNFCYNQSLTIGGKKIDKNNLIDSLKLLTTVGCDSTIVLIGTERGFSTYKPTICSNSSVTVGNKVFDKNNTSGIVIIPGGSAFGCDSTIDVNITVKNFAQNDIIQKLCPGGSINVGGEVFDVNKPKGTHTFPLGSSTGCDSVVNVDLSFSNPFSNKIYQICQGDSIFISGSLPGNGKFISSRKPADTLFLIGEASLGCDSTVFISVQNIPNSIGFFRQTICRKDTIFLNGQSFHAGKTTGSFVLVNRAANGCDSTVQVDLTIRTDAIGKLDTSACVGSVINIFGTLLTEANPIASIKAPFTSSFGCDTFIDITANFIPEKMGNSNPTICRTKSITIGGQVFNANNPTGAVRISRTAAQGCDSIVQVGIIIAPPIITDFSKTDLKCNVANSGSMVINSINAGGGTNINISLDGKTPIPYFPNQSFSNLSEGSHKIIINDAFGCDTTFNIIIGPSQILNLSLPGDTTIFQGASVILNSKQNFVPTKITWDPTLYLSCPDCLNPTSTPDQDVTYVLTLEDENGCMVNDNITIRVKIDDADIYVPNVFSPNGDNINDFLTPEFRFPDKTKINIFRVFDRWGTLVYERLNGGLGEKFGWDGRFNAKDLNPGVFTYAIQYQAVNQDAKWKYGDVTIVR